MKSVNLEGCWTYPLLEADYPVSEAYLKFLAKAQATPNKFAPAPAAVKP